MGVNYNTRIVTSGLVFYLDSENTKSYPGSGTSWYDISSSAKTGTMNGTITYSAGDMTFSSAGSGYVTASDLGNLSTWTCESWFNMTSLPGATYPSLITNVYPGTFNKVNYMLGYYGANAVLTGFYDGTWHVTTGYATVISTWYQAVGTYDGSTIKLYINGVLQPGSLSYVATPTTSAGGIRVGRRWDNAEYINGKINVAKIYNRALTDAEVEINFNALRGRFGI